MAIKIGQMKQLALVAVCLLSFLNLNAIVNAQEEARNRFMKEAPAAWAEYRRKLSTDIQIQCQLDWGRHYDYVVTKQGQTIYKEGRGRGPIDRIEMYDGECLASIKSTERATIRRAEFWAGFSGVFMSDN